MGDLIFYLFGIFFWSSKQEFHISSTMIIMNIQKNGWKKLFSLHLALVQIYFYSSYYTEFSLYVYGKRELCLHKIKLVSISINKQNTGSVHRVSVFRAFKKIPCIQKISVYFSQYTEKISVYLKYTEIFWMHGIFFNTWKFFPCISKYMGKSFFRAFVNFSVYLKLNSYL